MVFTSDLFVETFGAITLNTSGIPNVVGFGLLLGSAAFMTLQSLFDLCTRHDVMVSQSDFLKSNKGWLEEHHGYLMADRVRPTCEHASATASVCTTPCARRSGCATVAYRADVMSMSANPLSPWLSDAPPAAFTLKPPSWLVKIHSNWSSCRDDI